MPTFIAKLEDHYFEWSTIVDAPVSEPMTLDRFTEYYRERNGSEGMRDLSERLARVDVTGCSSRQGETVEDLLLCNRAGENESAWSLEQFKEWARGTK